MMMDAKTNGNEPAHPVEGAWKDGEFLQGAQTGNTSGWASGLTKRETFAMAAMQALLSSATSEFRIHTDAGTLIVPCRQAIPPLAVQYADALLAELAEEDDA